MHLTSQLSRRGEWPEMERHVQQLYKAILGYYASRLHHSSSNGR